MWSLDFVADQLADGRRFRALTILDVFTRESLAIEVGQRLRGDDVVQALNGIRQKRGVPKLLFCDNGSEFTSQVMDLWAYHNRVQIDFEFTSYGAELLILGKGFRIEIRAAHRVLGGAPQA